jgi:general stress protein 26
LAVMSERELKGMCRLVLETAWPAYLTTVDDTGAPHTRAMFNLRNREHFPKLIPLFEQHAEDFMVVFTTNTSSEKTPHIGANPKVSAYYCEPASWKGVMLGGEVELVDDSEFRKSIWHDGWERYYPGGVEDPDHTVLRLFPTLLKGWTGSETFNIRVK